MSQSYAISELAKEFGVTPRTLRFYEDKGLLGPVRKGTVRQYSERDRTRLKLTLRGRRLGFTLDECTEIIDMYEPGPDHDTPQLLHLCAKIRQHRTLLIQKISDIEQTLAAMDGVEQKCLDKLLENEAR